jgi:hypothetical protein
MQVPKQYEAMRDKFRASGLSGKAAKAKAARIYNANHPDTPVTRYQHAETYSKRAVPAKKSK